MNPYYDEDGITIYHGDALEVLPSIPARAAQAVITDPPYIIGAVSAGNMASKSGGWADMMNSSHWFTAWYREIDRILPRDGVFWSFLNWRTLPVVMRSAIDAGLPITSLAVWDKRWIGPGGVQGLRPSYELIALLCRPDHAIPDRGIADIIPHQVGSYKEHGHPAQKPEGLIHRLIDISALPTSSTILDPFMGSGTSLVAAKASGRRAIGIESEERWCEVAATRLSQGVLNFGASA